MRIMYKISKGNKQAETEEYNKNKDAKKKGKKQG